MKKSYYLLLSLLVIGIDQWSKWWVENNIRPYEAIRIVTGHFQLIFAKNTGIAFGLFPSRGELFGTVVLALLGLVALGLVCLLFARTPREHPLLLLALSLVLGGAIGNLIDRVVLGAVTDFFDAFWGAKHFPTFNVADSAISIGIALLAWDSVFGTHRVAHSDRARPDTACEDSTGAAA